MKTKQGKATTMQSISQSPLSEAENNSRYLPHTLETRLGAVKLYRSSVKNQKKNSVDFVCRKYHCSKASLMRWNAAYDGTANSLMDKSHRPLHVHPSAHTDEERRWIKNLMRRSPHMPPLRLWAKLKAKYQYKRSPMSLWRELKRLGYVSKSKINHTSKVKHNKKYQTPRTLGEKWQIDVKYVPSICIGEKLPEWTKFYQYTCLEEASRERYIFFYDEYGPEFTVNFLKRAILYFGYLPKEIQTDNGMEFSYPHGYMKKEHPLHAFCKRMKIKHHSIKPRTPEHNGKVERSHQKDNKDFYSWNTFSSLQDLRKKGRLYLNQYNNTPIRPLDYKTPLEKRAELEPISKLRRVKLKKKEAKKK